VLRRELRRLAAICFSEAIVGLPLVLSVATLQPVV
jgi:hypothetical protein